MGDNLGCAPPYSHVMSAEDCGYAADQLGYEGSGDDGRQKVNSESNKDRPPGCFFMSNGGTETSPFYNENLYAIAGDDAYMLTSVCKGINLRW